MHIFHICDICFIQVIGVLESVLLNILGASVHIVILYFIIGGDPEYFVARRMITSYL